MEIAREIMHEYRDTFAGACKMSEPIWLDVDDHSSIIHAEQLAIFGGPEGIRDHGLLEFGDFAAQSTNGIMDKRILAALAAAYAFGLARNHPFVDGNKRIAFDAMMVFLGNNGINFPQIPDMPLQ